MARKRLTKRVIDSLKTDRERGERVYDTELPGFGVLVYPSGRKTFFITYGGRTTRKTVTLGLYGPLTPDSAREKATLALAQVINGGDPKAERERKQAEAELTFAKWADEYYEEIRERKKYLKADKRFFKLAKEHWSGRPLVSIGVQDVQKVLGSIAARGTKIEANRWLASIRACLQAAWRMDKIPTNPAMKVKPYPENPPRNRVLDDEEFKRLCEQVDKWKEPPIRAAFVLLITTGARLSEVLKAKWEDFDFDQGRWRIPSSKSGRSQVIPISSGTVAMLKGLDRKGELVVPGRDPDKPRHDLKRPWEKIRKKAKLDGVVIHDIRRTFGLQVAKGAGLHIASRLLRHTDIKVTQRHYAPLGIEDLQDVVERRDADLVALPLKTSEAE